MHAVSLLLALGACHDPGPPRADPAQTTPGPTTSPPTTPQPTTPPAPSEPSELSGATIEGDRVVFRIPSARAERIEAWIYAAPLGADPALTVALERAADGRFTGEVSRADLDAAGVTDVWYGLRAWGPNWPYDPAWTPGSEVGFRADVDAEGDRFDPNKLLLDPWARELSHEPGADWGPYTTGGRRAEDTGPIAPKGLALPPPEPVGARPDVALRDAVVYEVHPRGLSMTHPDVPEDLRGTYAGAALLAPALADLGVTVVELLPVHETSNDRNDDDPNSASGDNYWGYSTLSYFAPDARYAADRSPGGPNREFQAMVRAFHEAGLEVWLDVVYNHTAEGGTWGDADTAPLLSWRGLDNAGFYPVTGDGRGYRNDNGVGPNLAATSPLARDLVIDSLQHWVAMGVDGFRFDLASVLGNGCEGDCFEWDPNDPEGILVRAREEVDADLVAEPWSVTGWQGGQYPDGWSEWNDGFRDLVRADQNRLGTVDVTPGRLADALSGSWSRYGDDGRPPWASVNYLSAHDGMTLGDLYRCNVKDNDQDWPWGPSGGGTDNDLAWDQGGDPVAQRRAARTGMGLLLVSAGVPMFVGGDEFLRTQQCNNNMYNIDSVGSWLDWDAAADADDFTHFVRTLLAFRAAHPALRPDTWRPDDQIAWYTPQGTLADAGYLDDPHNHAIAFRLDGPAAGDPANAVYVAYNGWTTGIDFALPPAPSGGRWRIVADSHEWLEPDGNAFAAGTEPPLPDDRYLLGARSLVILVD
ncbi:MAG: alpha-amylase family glycosyl hydrolase [Myxococcota bacterium]